MIEKGLFVDRTTFLKKFEKAIPVLWLFTLAIGNG